MSIVHYESGCARNGWLQVQNLESVPLSFGVEFLERSTYTNYFSEESPNGKFMGARLRSTSQEYSEGSHFLPRTSRPTDT